MGLKRVSGLILCVDTWTEKLNVYAGCPVNLSTGSVMKSPLDSLIEELEAGAWQLPEISEVVVQEKDRKEGRRSSTGAEWKAGQPPSEPKDTYWPSESLDAEWRFRQPHAKLFPFIGRKVRTPTGPGMLVQVFAERVTVLLDSDLDKCAVFRPCDVEPTRRDL